MASQTLDQITSSGANGNRTAPVGAEIPVSVQGSRPMPAVGGAEQAPVPFVEQTKTVIVFANGAVVRLAEGVFPGQILILKNLKNDREAACRVISSKSIGNVQGYVEVEFTHSTTGFWEGEASRTQISPAGKSESSDSLPPAAAEISYSAPKAPSDQQPSEEDAMSKALADAFSSLMSPATKSPAPESGSKRIGDTLSSGSTAQIGSSETMRSPGLATKIPAIPAAPPVSGPRSSVLANAKPVAIADLIGTAPTSNSPDSETTEGSYKPPSAYRGIEPRKSSMAPEMPVRAEARPVQQTAPVARASQRKAGGQWLWMLAGVAASAALMVGGFFGYRWYVGGGAPTAPSQTSAATNSNAVASAAPVPVNPSPAKISTSEPERVIVRATPLDPPPVATPANTKPAPANSANTGANPPTPKPDSVPAATRARQSSVLTMKTRMASPKAPINAAGHSASSNAALPDIANAGSSTAPALLTTALGGSLVAPPGGANPSSNIVQAKLISTVAPIYPQNATINSIEGDVKIDAIIGPNGHVGTMKVLDGPLELRQAALTAVAQWRYEPEKLDGKAIASHLTVLVKFRLKK